MKFSRIMRWQYSRKFFWRSRERLNADGRFGAATAAAVQRFQRRSGLTADGVVGEETWEKMF